jgi:putative flippase GtrA
MVDLYARLREHPYTRRMLRHPFSRKIVKYALGSGVALATSVIVFALMLTAGVGTTIDSIVAFLAGAIPNWILNRRWAWQKTGQVEVAREVIGYVVVSVLALIAASAGTGAAQHWARHHAAHGLHAILVTGAYVVVQALLFVVKFVIYDRWVFAGRSRFRAALRSRHQVWTAARANRTP